MDHDLLNAPYDADIAAAVEKLRQSWLELVKRRKEVKKLQQAKKQANETLPLKGFEEAYTQAMYHAYCTSVATRKVNSAS